MVKAIKMQQQFNLSTVLELYIYLLCIYNLCIYIHVCGKHSQLKCPMEHYYILYTYTWWHITQINVLSCTYVSTAPNFIESGKVLITHGIYKALSQNSAEIFVACQPWQTSSLALHV